MASQTLRPHRSPSPGPAPSTPTLPGQPAKLTRQSLGPPTASSGAAKGFGNLGIASPTTSQPRHASSGVMPGNNRESLGARPSLGSGNRGVQGGRPSSEFLPGARDARSRTPETEQIDQWFKHLANWEQTLEEMAAASTDQNFTEELGAIEQWFRVLSEAERTAALYSLLQHSTPVQIRFFSSVLQHMSQSDPLTAILSPNPNSAQSGLASQMDKLSTFKSPSAGGGNGFTGSPGGSYLDDPAKVRARQNRISAPGTLQPNDRWGGGHHLDQVLERGSSPDNGSSRSRSPAGDLRPKSENFGGKTNDTRSPRQSGVGLGLDAPISPLLNNPSWASMVSTPLAPAFNDPSNNNMAPQTNLTSALNMANLQLAASKIAFEDARKYRRPSGQTPTTSRNVSGQSEDSYATPHSRGASPLLNNYGGYQRSPVMDQFGLGLGDNSALAGLGMNFANLGINPMNANAAQMLAIAQAQQQINQSNAALAGGYSQNAYHNNNTRSTRPSVPPGRRSPMPNNVRSSPTPQATPAGGGGGAGGGAGVAGPDDVDIKTIEDVGNWLRVLRLHKYTSTFEKYKWQDMVAMNDQDLQDKGVAAQGARTKFLKVFHNVRTQLGMPHPPGQEEFAASKDN